MGVEPQVLEPSYSGPQMTALYGAPGTGKTHMLSTFPRPLVVLNTDPGGPDTLRRFASQGNIFVVDFVGGNAKELVDFINLKLGKFIEEKAIATVALDSFTGLGRLFMKLALRIGSRGGKSIPVGSMGEPDRSHYFLESYASTDTVVNLVALKGVNVVVTFHDQFVSNEETGGILRGTVSARGKASDTILNLFGNVFHMEPQQKVVGGRPTSVHMLRTRASAMWSAKTRMPGLDELEEPNYLAMIEKSNAAL